MARLTGKYRVTSFEGEQVRAFIPNPLPPAGPTLVWDEDRRIRHDEALIAVDKLAIAASLVPNADWFLYGFVRKEAVISSQIEGTQATLQDVLMYEATERSERPDDVNEVCNYVSRT